MKMNASGRKTNWNGISSDPYKCAVVQEPTHEKHVEECGQAKEEGQRDFNLNGQMALFYVVRAPRLIA